MNNREQRRIEAKQEIISNHMNEIIDNFDDQEQHKETEGQSEGS